MIVRPRRHRIDPGALILLLGLLLLGASGLVDQIERHPGLDSTRALIAVDVAVLVLSWIAWSFEALLTRTIRLLRRGMGHALFAAALMGVVVFALVLEAHLAHPPRLDGWLALGGALLLVMAGVVGSIDSP